MTVETDSRSLQNSNSGSVSSRSSNAGKSSSVESSSVNTANNSNKGSFIKAAKLELSGPETIYVNRLRYVILLVLTSVAFGISCLIYFLVDSASTTEMENDYERIIGQLTNSFEDIRNVRIASLASLAIAVNAHGMDHETGWPFVSLSFFQERAYIPNLQSGVLQVSIAPFVSSEDKANWEAYIVGDGPDVSWIEESIKYQKSLGVSAFITDYGINWRNKSEYQIKHWINDSAVPLTSMDDAFSQFHLPSWQMSPFVNFDEVNIDILQDSRGEYARRCFEEGVVVLSGLTSAPAGSLESENRTTANYARLLSIQANQQVDYQGDPMSNFFIPIFDSFTGERNTVAVLVGLFNWGSLFAGVLPPNFGGIDLVLQNACYESYTYNLGFKGVVTPIGKGDRHDPKFNTYGHVMEGWPNGTADDGTRLGRPFANSACQYYISTYPTQVFMDEYHSAAPMIVAIISFVFCFAIFLFLVYDGLVERRQAIVLQKALQSTAVVSSLFPKNVRDRILNFNGSPQPVATDAIGASIREKLLSKRLGQETSHATYGNTAQTYKHEDTIADLFPNCTVLFADIAGFTAWSSSRSPEQVFTLLQNVYQAFDKIASRRKVFKVETIGDSYVAVTGLPEPQEDHAVIMAKFARECLEKMSEVTGALEVLLGPDTTELSMRFGLNSGQVTGGVLMGERARFQLFGDTVNTAARMESTGILGKIQLSQSTAELLTAAGKGNWIQPREDVVKAKGKGTMQTYWLISKSSSRNKKSNEMAGVTQDNRGKMLTEEVSTDSKLLPQHHIENSEKMVRIIGWMSEVLIDYIKQIVAKNEASGITSVKKSIETPTQPSDKICLDELVESFKFIKVTKEEKKVMREKYVSVKLSEDVVHQTRLYVQKIAALYNASNPFHNFDHACHVTMSVHKLMKRVVTDGTNSEEGIIPTLEQERQDTYGILTSDPLTLFAIVFSALIHDVDHPGVSNGQFAQESPEVAEHYQNKSIAEQKSFDISWNLLMGDEFIALRKAIFPRQADLIRFREVVVNIVLATDIFDKEMGDMRKERWEKVFGNNSSSKLLIADDETMQNTRATIVLEHIIQASDVSHSMQHWHVYLKWNKRLFEEMSFGFAQGRVASDPAIFWYQGELNFFDKYVIPLAKKIGECGVFGVSSDEYLEYALSNRREWEVKGMDIVADMMTSQQRNNPTATCA